MRFSKMLSQFLSVCFEVRRSKISDKTDEYLINYSNYFRVHFLSGHSV